MTAILLVFLQTTQSLVRQHIASYQTVSLILNSQATLKEAQKIQQRVEDDFRLQFQNELTFQDSLNTIKQNFDLELLNTDTIAPLFYGVIQFQVKDDYLPQLETIINRLSVFEEVEEVVYFPDQLKQAMTYRVKINQLSLAVFAGLGVIYLMLSWYGTSALVSLHRESLALKALFGANFSVIYLPFFKEIVIMNSLALTVPLGLMSFLSQKIPSWLGGVIVKFQDLVTLGGLEYDPFFLLMTLAILGFLLNLSVVHLHLSKLS